MMRNKSKEDWVREFHKLDKDDPQIDKEFSIDAIDGRIARISEESEELIDAFYDARLDLFRFGKVSQATKENLMKELCDLMFVLSGAAVQFKNLFQVGPAFVRVAKSNLTKANPTTGSTEKRSDGKILKGPWYTPPDLSDLV
jgi:enoyl reductase-like protein